ncbi:MAG TPA: CPBP family intramembrane glutamic endopeptidase [Xanthobacteraceae bacterium]|jgi:membrane protease YdiL (CAAX protease family)|nr:CPBP family intramembrane glutamic endopeptidase [Xanthobacteraceae bacterium]
MAITRDGASAAPEPPAAMVDRPESVGRLILIAIGWWLLTELASGFPVGFAVGVLKRFQNISLFDPIPATVMVFLAGCTLLIAVRKRSVVVGHGDRRAGVDDRPITRWWLLVVLAVLAAAWAFVASAFWNGVFPQWVSNWRGASPWTLIAFTVGTVILAPFAEELFYRGWLWTGVRQHWRAFPTALLSCGLWLLSHIDRGLLVPIMLIPTAVILGFARHFCGIRAAIILHGIYNLVVVLVLGLLLTRTS